MPVSEYSDFSPSEIFDLRCEYDAPRFLDLNNIDEGIDAKVEEEFFKWFQISHDFKVNPKFMKINKYQLLANN